MKWWGKKGRRRRGSEVQVEVSSFDQLPGDRPKALGHSAGRGESRHFLRWPELEGPNASTPVLEGARSSVDVFIHRMVARFETWRGKRRRYNEAWAQFRSRGQLRFGIPKELASAADLVAVRAAATAQPFQPAIRLFLHGPDIAGVNIPLPMLGEGCAPSDVLLHRALFLLEKLLDTVGRGRAYGGLWSVSGTSCAVVIWVEYNDSRLCAIPQFHLGPTDISVSLSHAVLWRQPWMTEHDADDFGWADLTTNYQTHFGDGGTYWEALTSWNKGERMWQQTRYGVEFTQAYGSPVQMSQTFQSFYNFHIGEPQFPAGTQAGQDLHRIANCLAVTAQNWAQSVRANPTAGPSFARRPGSIWQEED